MSYDFSDTTPNCRVPYRALAIAYLTKDGNLSVPCSRYGRDSEECAAVAWRVAYLYARESGQAIEVRDLDYAMGLVVNDSDDVSYLVNNYGNGDYKRG